MTGAAVALEAVVEKIAVVESPVYGCVECCDVGMVVKLDALGRSVGAAPCRCRMRKVMAQRMERAGLPGKYREASFVSFQDEAVDPTIALAARMCKRAVDELVTASGPRGILLTGPCGVGKTHLAAASLGAAMTDYGMSGKFWDVAGLLTAVKRSFDKREVEADSESTILTEFASTQVLVLDELGGERLTDWSFDEMRLLLNQRYNEDAGPARLTIFTTNFENLGPGEGRGGVKTLGDQLGMRIWSRLQEMCRVVEMTGSDWRRRRG